MPCGPNKTSFRKLSAATQMICITQHHRQQSTTAAQNETEDATHILTYPSLRHASTLRTWCGVLTGEMSTPPIGGKARLVGPSTGSVGATTTTQGSFFPSNCGYQLSTIRTIMKRMLTDSTGLRTVAILLAVCASMSARAYSPLCCSSAKLAGGAHSASSAATPGTGSWAFEGLAEVLHSSPSWEALLLAE